MKIIFFSSAFLVFLIVSIPAYSQLATLEQVNELKERSMLVQLAEIDEDILSQLSKKAPGRIEEYKSAIATYNENLKYAVESFWPWQSEFKYVTQNEAKGIQKSKDKSYAIIYQKTIVSLNSPYYFELVWDEDLLEQGLINYHYFQPGSQYALQLSFIEDYGGKIIASAESNRILPTKTEMASLIIKMAGFDNDVATGLSGLYEKNNKKSEYPVCQQLKEITLIINSNDLSPELTITKIQEIYPYKFEVLNDNEIEKLFSSKSTGYIYIFGSPIYASGGTINLYTFIDIGKSEKLSNCHIDPIRNMNNYKLLSQGIIIDEKTLKEISLKITGKE